tara:strand:- start:437004 stop:442349 length:5346 start_codon:yes stop_codon:yes gene_type:complete
MRSAWLVGRGTSVPRFFPLNLCALPVGLGSSGAKAQVTIAMVRSRPNDFCNRFHGGVSTLRRFECLETRRLLATTPFNIADYPALPAIVDVGLGSLTSVRPAGEPAPSPAPRVTGDFTGPVAAAEWWSAIAFETSPTSMPIFSHPLSTQTRSDGLAVGYPRDPVVWDSGYRYLHDENLRIKLDGLSTAGASVASYSDWTVTTRWQSGVDRLETTFGHGLPFVYATRQGTRDAVVQFDQSVTVRSNTAGVAHISIQGKEYGLFGPSSSQWIQSGRTFTNDLNGDDFFSVALLPDGSSATLEYFRQRAYAFVTDTSVTWDYDASTSTSNATYSATTELKESGNGHLDETLMALYRHQWLNSSTPLTGYSYNSSRGQMKVASGASFMTSMTHYGTLPLLPEVGADPAQLYSYVDQLFQQANILSTSDSYFTGTDMFKLAQLIPLAEQVGHIPARDRFLSEVRSELEDWFDADDGGNGQFYYDQSWDALIGYPDSFGSAQDLNDHHFHYGYFIQSAAIVAMYDPLWAQESNWGGMVELLIRDVANWERDDQTFQFIRNFDAYAGHSWASGNALFQRGNNQESSSEAMHFANGLIHWGSAVGDDAIRDLGIYMVTTHQAALEQYWFDVDDAVFNPAYPHPMIGILWSDGVDYTTFFSPSPELIQGINYLPLTGGSLYLGHDPAYVQSVYDHVVQQNGGPVDEWTDLMASYLAFADPATALADFNASPSSETQPLAKNYHWISALNELGHVDPTVTADLASYAVFDKAGQKTYVAYNPADTDITASYSDGTTISVPAFTYIASGATNFSWRPGQYLSVAADETSISEFNGTAIVTVTRSGDTTAAADVTLTSSDVGQAIVVGAATVTIPIGQTSATFAIEAVDDLLIDGTQAVSFTVSATGFQDRSVDILVTDDEPASGVSDTLYLFDGAASPTVYFQNFDGLNPSPTVLAADGWQYYSDNAGLGAYSGPALGDGPQISALIDAGANHYINFYANYDNGAVHSNPARREAISLFRSQPFSGADAASADTFHFDFDFARNAAAPITGDTEVGAFIRVFDGSFNLLAQQTFDTIGAVNSFTAASTLSQTLNPAWVNGGTIQFGFNNRVGNYNGSGIFYDNVRITRETSGTLSPTPGLAAASDTIPVTGGSHIGTPDQPLVYTVSGIDGIYDASKTTQFELYLDAGQSGGNATQARVRYDFDGDGTDDRVETYDYFATDPVDGWQSYFEAAGLMSQSGLFADFNNGSVRLELWKAFGSGDVLVRTGATMAQGQQSAIVIPFASTEDPTVRVEFASDWYGEAESAGANLPRLLVDGTLASSATIDVAVVSATATAGSDYTHVLAVDLPAGTYDGTLATSLPIDLSVIDDGETESNESIEFRLTNPSAGLEIHDANGDGVVQKPTTYWILDDDHLVGESLADYRFQTNLDVSSSDSHVPTLASDITSGGAAMVSSAVGNPDRGLLLGPGWNESIEVGPETASTNYLTFTVTPEVGSSLSAAELSFDLFRDSADSIGRFAVYADEDAGMNPGASGGDNFESKIGGGAVTSTGSWTTVRVPLGGVPFLQQVESPVAVRIYFWSDTEVGGVAIVDNVQFRQVGIGNSAAVDRVVINEGEPQRSSLSSVQVVFEDLVNAPAAAFSLTNLGIPSGSSSIDVNSLSVSTAAVLGQTVATITFDPGTSVITRDSVNTLADGNYRLVIDAALVTTLVGGQPMVEDFVFGADPADEFFRLYGDTDGDGSVNFTDFASGFLPAFATSVGSANYRDELDANGDASVDFSDFASGFLPNFATRR